MYNTRTKEEPPIHIYIGCKRNEGCFFRWTSSYVAKGKTFDDAIVIGEQEGGLYKLKGQLEQDLVHDSVEPNELRHRRLAHVHYRALPLATKVVEGLPELQTKHEGVYKGCTKEKNIKKTFPSSESKAKGILEIIHSDVCDPMSSSSLSGYAYYVSLLMTFLGIHGFTL